MAVGAPGGRSLALSFGGAAQGAPGSAEGEVLNRWVGTWTGGRCRPGLSVANLDEFHKRLVERNVPCIQQPKEIFGARIAQYLDPDGLAISVSEERRGGG
jgi:hypothetical protein